MITIKNNDRGRRFLVFDTLFDLDNNHDFQEGMFNAVYIMNVSLSETITILRHINPITSQKCCYKPFFVSKRHEGKLLEYSDLVDGYIYDITDAEADSITENILTNLNEMGIQRIVDDLSSSNMLFIRLLRYYISRKKQQLVPVLTEGSNLGYVLPMMSIFYKMKLYRHREYIVFMQTMFEKGYLRATQFLNKVYLCPQCMHTHLLYLETCPKCGSSNIKSEEVIHHFRCANIAPESAYNYGGQLRCPKCHRLLRHIGVDYDRPATVYFCKSCSNNFLQPNMKTICTNCKQESTVASLIPNDVVAYEITEKGKRELISTSVYGSIFTEFYDNYIEYEHFTNRIRLLARQALNANNRSDVSVVQIWQLDSHMATRPLKSEFISYVCDVFKYNNISFANYMLYIKCAEQNDSELEDFNRKLTEAMTRLSYYIQPDEVLCYSRVSLTDDKIDDFVNRLDFVPEVPDGYFGHRDIDTADGTMPRLEPLNSRTEHMPAAEYVAQADNDNSDPAPGKQPAETAPRQSGKRRILIVLAALAAVLIGVMAYVANHKADEPKPAVKEVPEASVAATDAPTDSTAEATVTDSVPAPHDNSAEVAEAAVTDGADCIPGRHYVVAGTFKNKANAIKEKEQMQQKMSSLKISVYFNGSRYIVTPFESDSREECARFVESNRSTFADAWIL